MRRVIDRATLEDLIQTLRGQLRLCFIQAASFDNDAYRRAQIAERKYAIQLLFDLLGRGKRMGVDWRSRPANSATRLRD